MGCLLKKSGLSSFWVLVWNEGERSSPKDYCCVNMYKVGGAAGLDVGMIQVVSNFMNPHKWHLNRE